ncbi:kinase-like domain-containing protein [Pilaira anomala]|nr:kinase-like domain-containing protein [Pilaira anomala]
MSSSNSQSTMENVGDYIIKEKIGQGSFATVYKAQHKFTNQIVAVKSVRRSKLTKKLLENLESEISILTAIRHDHIVGLIECQKTESNIFLVMEFCSLGDLSHYIKDIRANNSTKGPAGGLPERVVRHFLKQLANALEFLRSKNLVHRDIKPQNLLLVKPKDSSHNDLPILKVADFGFARFLPNASLADTLCGSPLYMGPEILSYKKYDAKADLWSVGSVLYEMVTGRPPFRAQNHIELLKKIQENKDRIMFPDEQNLEIMIGSDLKDIIRKLLKKNPIERISFEDFFSHPAVLNLKPPQQQTIMRTRSCRTTTTATTTTNTMNQQKNSSYEPPPFAQRSSDTTTTTTATRRWSTIDQLSSPLYSKGRPVKFESKDNLWRPTSPSPSQPLNSGKQQRRMGEEEDMLQEYVILDRRIIETNQFADELDASPRTSAIPMTGNTVAAVNIPISPSTPPFTRERKTSTSTSTGSALAKAVSKASVRLFGPIIPSPPKESSSSQHHPTGSPHGFLFSSHTSNTTMKHIEGLACMAHAVTEYADQKYNLFDPQQPSSMLADEIVSLYFKSLSLLEVGLYVAQQYWQNYSNSSSSSSSEVVENEKNLTVQLNDAVQWMRDKFNECLKRAQSIQDRQSVQNCCVEKILYDRALEMSRAAAVHELVGENMTECEQDYQTAIWMLKALLQVRPSDEISIEEEDKQIIAKFIESIRHRITVLRKKMERA